MRRESSRPLELYRDIALVCMNLLLFDKGSLIALSVRDMAAAADEAKIEEQS